MRWRRSRLRRYAHLLRDEGPAGFVRRARARWRRRRTPPNLPRLESTLAPVVLPDFAFPRVSIIVPAYNQALFTFNCMLWISRHTSTIPYEVIVVDDASTDHTTQVLSLVSNVRVVRNTRNMGFVDGCNAGAAQARGDSLMFLNNDALVTAGWLPPLHRLLDEDETCGAVGPKLVYPDGRLQEAGSIIWRDGKAWNYGKLDDPEKAEYNYVRDVDYCSAAALLVRRRLFEKLGGFDRRFSPGYWEDTDLCFSLRARGYQVRYQPASVVVHFEGQTAGRDTGHGMKHYQMVNSGVFREKWSHALEGQSTFDDFFHGRDRNRSRTFLVLDHCAPMHDRDAGSFFMWSVLRRLRERGFRVVFWPHNRYRLPGYTDDLQQLGVEVAYGDGNLRTYLRRHGAFFEAALVHRTHVVEAHLKALKKHVPRVVFFCADLESLRESRRLAVLGGSNAGADASLRLEAELMSRCDQVTVHSPFERDLILKRSPALRVTVLPLPVRAGVATAEGFGQRSGLLFVGSSHPPNVDAIEHFARDIRPLVQEELPDLELLVVGEVGQPAGQLEMMGQLRLTGHVPTVEPYYRHARVFVAPLRYGAGIKGKILEAMAFGVPVVTTPVGAEGIGLTHGVTAMIADNAPAFAAAVLTLYRDRDLWSAVRANARQLVDEQYSAERFGQRLDDLLDGGKP